MSDKKRVKIFKIILAILVILILVLATIYLMPLFKNISTVEGQLAFKEKVQDAGFLGMLMLFGLQFARNF